MVRLLSWPEVGVSYLEPMSGPAARGSGSNTYLDGSEQTFATPGDRVSFRLEFAPAQGASARRLRGWQMGLHNGANWTRWAVTDGDRPTFDELGYNGKVQPWSNGQTWSNGAAWAPSYPTVDVIPFGSGHPAGSDIVRLKSEFWANDVAIGWVIGFGPFHFGCYWVTEIVDTRQYRVWPRLRSEIDDKSWATLTPQIVMRMAPNSRSGGRSPLSTEGQGLVLSEVLNSHVQAHPELI